MDYPPPGFRFYPTEEELVSFYLQNKLLDGSRQDLDRVIPVLHIYDFSPWDLPKYAGEFCQGDPEQWFFFIPRQDKETRGGRPNRLTSSGYWKATGSPGLVYSSYDNRVIGMKRTMVFYEGRAPNGTKTEWKMNEYKAASTINDHQPPNSSSSSSSTSTTSSTLQLRQELSLCRVYKRSKCLRSFDRRPSSGVVAIGQGGTSVEAGTTSVSADQNQNQNQNMMMMMRSSSPADDHDHSSSSGDYSNNNIVPSHRLDTDDQPMWEWDWEPMLGLGTHV